MSQDTTNKWLDEDLHRLIRDKLWLYGVWDDMTHDQHVAFTKAVQAAVEQIKVEAILEDRKQLSKALYDYGVSTSAAAAIIAHLEPGLATLKATQEHKT